MARLTTERLAVAAEIIARYPVRRSAIIPLCHLAQEQDGHLTDDAIEHVAELTGTTAAEVLGTASFYEMFKRHHVGRYLVNICTSISCFLCGADELVEHAEKKLGVRLGGTTDDGLITLEEYECQAGCTEAPCLQVNYRYFTSVTPELFDRLVADLRTGALDDTVPDHGVLARVRQRIPPDRAAGPADPKTSTVPVWYADRPALAPEPAVADRAQREQPPQEAKGTNGEAP